MKLFKKNHITACSCEERTFDLGRAERENVSHDCKEISGESTPPHMRLSTNSRTTRHRTI